MSEALTTISEASGIIRMAKELSNSLGAVAPIRVLVVDDLTTDCALIKNWLQSSGRLYEVDCCYKYDDAIAAVSKKHFDVIFIDESLGPKKGGLGFIEETRTMGLNVPFVMVTGNNSKDADTRAMGADCMAFISKNTMSGESLDRAARYSIKNHVTRSIAQHQNANRQLS